jgi:tetratricopeptide (TPR) repeat protein
MNRPPIRNPRRALFLWAVLLVLGVALAEAFTFSLAGYGRQLAANDYRTHLAAAFDRMNRFDYVGALAEIEYAKQKAPDVAELYARAGDIHYQLKHWREAIQEYRDAIARGNRDEGARLNVVWSLIELKRYDDAIAFGKAAIKEGFTLPALPRYIAEACFRSGKEIESVQFYEMALDGYHNDLYLLDHLRQAYLKTRQTAKAEALRLRIADIEASLNAPRGPAPPQP